jgi:hypothetical protein
MDPLPREPNGLRVLLDGLGAPPGSPVLSERECCDAHPGWIVASLSVDYAPLYDRPPDADAAEVEAHAAALEAELSRVGPIGGAIIAAGGPWLIRAVDPAAREAIQWEADLACGGRWSVASPDTRRLPALARMARHVLRGHRWRPGGGRPPDLDRRRLGRLRRDVRAWLIAQAVAGAEITQDAAAAAVGYGDARALRQVLKKPWSRVLSEAMSRAPDDAARSRLLEEVARALSRA